MGDQQSFASMAWSPKGKVTRRVQFLAEMDGRDPVTAADRSGRTSLPRESRPAPAPSHAD